MRSSFPEWQSHGCQTHWADPTLPGDFGRHQLQSQPVHEWWQNGGGGTSAQGTAHSSFPQWRQLIPTSRARRVWLVALLTWSLQLTYQIIESNKRCVNLQCGEAGRTLKITWEDYTKYISPILCCQNNEPLIFFLPF